MNPQGFYPHDSTAFLSDGLHSHYYQYQPSQEPSMLETPTSAEPTYAAYPQDMIPVRSFEGVPLASDHYQEVPDLSPISPVAPHPTYLRQEVEGFPPTEAIQNTLPQSSYVQYNSTHIPSGQIGERLDEMGIHDTMKFDEHNMIRRKGKFGAWTLEQRRGQGQRPFSPTEVAGEDDSGEASSSSEAVASSSNQTPEQSDHLEHISQRGLEMPGPSTFDQTAIPRLPHALSIAPRLERRGSFANTVLSQPPWSMTSFSIEPAPSHPHSNGTVQNGPHRLHANSRQNRAHHLHPYPSYIAAPLPQPPVPTTSSQPGRRSPSPEHILTETHTIPHEDLDRYFTPVAEAELMSMGKGGASGRKSWICPQCKKNVRKQDRASHMLGHEGKKRFDCRCGKKFGRPQDADRHLREQAPCHGCQGKMGRYGKNRRCSSCMLEIEQGRADS